MGEKKEESSSWNFKLDQQDAPSAAKKTSASDRLAKQKVASKESQRKLNLETNGKTNKITRTEIARMEAEKAKIHKKPAPVELRLKSAGIDIFLSFALWIVSNSVKNPIGLLIINWAKENNKAYMIEDIPSFDLLIRMAVFGALYFVFILLPTVMTSKGPGKMLTKTRIEHMHGGSLNKGPLFLRETLGKFLSIVSIVGLFMLFKSKKKPRFLHDKLFSSFVCKD